MNAGIKVSLMVVMLLLAAACSNETKQTQPVISKTGSGTSTAPPAKEAGQRDNALVRVINAVPGNVSFDIFADDKKVFESVAFKNVTPYKELSDDRHSFRVRNAGQDMAQPALAISRIIRAPAPGAPRRSASKARYTAWTHAADTGWVIILSPRLGQFHFAVCLSPQR